MRGPRDVKAEVSAGTVVDLLVMAGADGNVALAGATGVLLGEAGRLAGREARRLADGMRERPSFKKRWQNFITETSDMGMPFWVSNSLMAR